MLQAKAAAEREAAQIAKRRALDEQAAEMERQKAKEALEKQKKLKETMAAAMPKPAPRVPVMSEPVAKKPEPPVSVPEKKEEGGIFSSIFGSATKPAGKKGKWNITFSFFFLFAAINPSLLFFFHFVFKLL